MTHRMETADEYDDFLKEQQTGPVLRVYIGCSEAERLPAKVLAHTIRRNTEREVECHLLCDSEIEIPVPKEPGNRPVTLFSFQRFIVPQAAGYEGQALYLDSDMIVLGDIGEIFAHPVREGHILTPPGWQSAVMLYSSCDDFYSIHELVALIDEGRLKYRKLMNLRSPLFAVDESLSKNWNCTDHWPKGGKLIHYTRTSTQPWVATHPDSSLEKLWRGALLGAIKAGKISREELREEIHRRHVKPELRSILGEPLDDGDQARFIPPFDRYQLERKQVKK